MDGKDVDPTLKNVAPIDKFVGYLKDDEHVEEKKVVMLPSK